MADEKEGTNRDEERHEAERQRLFTNEGFLIVTLQAVSGAAVVAILSQLKTLEKFADLTLVLIALTTLVLAVLCVVGAALFRHHYVKWVVKMPRAAQKGMAELEEKVTNANRDLRRMRRLMDWGASLLCLSFILLLIALWCRHLGIVCTIGN